MYYLGVLIARYIDWCEAVQPRLKRWIGYAVFFGVATTVCVIILVLPTPFNLIFLLTGGFVIPPALLEFFSAHSKYWQRQDEIKREMRQRSLKVQELLKKTKWK
ncbi:MULTISPECIES: hypothetical protein [unclassified Roseovarius]|uniref:hypothetical protein n=1 Tax=unclassified Roseovarius TaxID=2614913 RepID=UPI00273D6CF9|nr:MULTISPECIES: hypothetical protein [unclassified Roseovarius]